MTKDRSMWLRERRVLGRWGILAKKDACFMGKLEMHIGSFDSIRCAEFNAPSARVSEGVRSQKSLAAPVTSIHQDQSILRLQLNIQMRKERESLLLRHTPSDRRQKVTKRRFASEVIFAKNWPQRFSRRTQQGASPVLCL